MVGIANYPITKWLKHEYLYARLLINNQRVWVLVQNLDLRVSKPKIVI